LVYNFGFLLVVNLDVSKGCRGDGDKFEHDDNKDHEKVTEDSVSIVSSASFVDCVGTC